MSLDTLVDSSFRVGWFVVISEVRVPLDSFNTRISSWRLSIVSCFSFFCADVIVVRSRRYFFWASILVSVTFNMCVLLLILSLSIDVCSFRIPFILLKTFISSRSSITSRRAPPESCMNGTKDEDPRTTI